MKTLGIVLGVVFLVVLLSIMAFFTLRSGAGAGAPQTAAGSGHAEEITDADFEARTASGVVLVDFWAPWCPPCRKQVPIVNRLAGRFEGRATIAKLNVDGNKASAMKHRVRSIPTLIIFVDGEVHKRMTGLQSEAVLAAELEEALGR